MTDVHARHGGRTSWKWKWKWEGKWKLPRLSVLTGGGSVCLHCRDEMMEVVKGARSWWKSKGMRKRPCRG